MSLVIINLITEWKIIIFQAFSIFCGLGIYNTQMYENASKLMAKQKVALEVLSYHASSSLDETHRLMVRIDIAWDITNMYYEKYSVL